MRNFIAKAALAALCICTVFSARAAGKVTFEASAPMVVATGEAFRVEFTVNASPDEGRSPGPTSRASSCWPVPCSPRGAISRR